MRRSRRHFPRNVVPTRARAHSTNGSVSGGFSDGPDTFGHIMRTRAARGDSSAPEMCHCRGSARARSIAPLPHHVRNAAGRRDRRGTAHGARELGRRSFLGYDWWAMNRSKPAPRVVVLGRADRPCCGGGSLRRTVVRGLEPRPGHRWCAHRGSVFVIVPMRGADYALRLAERAPSRSYRFGDRQACLGATRCIRACKLRRRSRARRTLTLTAG